MNPTVRASMEQAAAANAGGERSERMPVVMIIIFLAAAMFVSMVAVIYYRWVTVSAPTSAMLLIGDESLDGAVVIVNGVGMKAPQVITLARDNGFQSPLYLHPGSYELRVMHGDREVLRRQIDMYTNRGLRLNIREHIEWDRKQLAG